MNLIENPRAKRIAAEAAIAYGGLSAKEAITESARLDRPVDQVYVLRQWMLANRTRADAPEVLEHALGLSIRVTDYTLDAHQLRELVVCLPFIADYDVARRLIERIDGQADVVREIGPSEEFVRVQLVVARAEYRDRKDAARNRLVELYLAIGEIGEFATRIAAIARFVAAITALDPSRDLEQSEGLHGMAECDLESGIARLLESSADHYEATREIIDALAVHRPELAMSVVERLNAEARRDAAYRDLAIAAVRAATPELKPTTVIEALKRIQQPEFRDGAVQTIAHVLAGRRPDCSELTELQSVLWQVERIADPHDRVLAMAAVGTLLREQDCRPLEKLTATLFDKMGAAWAAIDEAWVRVGVGFELAATLGSKSEVLARRFAAEASDLRAGQALYSEASAASAIWCIRLAIRAFAGLLPQRLASSQERERIERAISRIASAGARIDLWADLAERYKLARQDHECREIVGSNVRPLLSEMEKAAPSDYIAAVARAAAAMYVAHRATALVTIRSLPLQWRDTALANIVEFVKRKCPLSDPYDVRAREGFDLSYDDVIDLCELMSEMDDDALIYYTAQDVIDSLSDSRAAISRQQKSEVARRLAELGSSKFPNRRNIQHDGWQVALRAQLTRLTPADDATWRVIMSDAEAIPNVADRAYVLAIAAAATKDPNERATALAKVDAAISEIPVLVDQVEHLRSTASLLVGVDRVASKRYLSRGLELTLKGKGRLVAKSRREIVDAAYRMDPEFASRLASNLDDDPAKDRVRRQIAIYELRKSMAQERPKLKLKDLEDIDVSRAAWSRLGSLTSGRVDHVPMEIAVRYLDVASRLTLSRAYPIFALLIENVCRRSARSDSARSVISPLFEATVLGAELAIHASSRARDELRVGLESVRDRVSGLVTVIDIGERERGINVLRAWISANVSGYLKISDPYFTPADVELLRLVREEQPTCEISVLTSRAAHTERGVSQPWDEAYENAWRSSCDDLPPPTFVAIVGNRSGASPVHDRWWFSRGSGLDAGHRGTVSGVRRSPRSGSWIRTRPQ